MNSKHTKSTWYLSRDLNVVVTVANHRVELIADFGKCSVPETEANARLIAAAPRLFEALKECLTEPEAHALNANTRFAMRQRLLSINRIVTDALSSIQ